MSDLALTGAERCDACGARAFVRAWIRLESTELLFCGHHWREVAFEFTRQGGICYSELEPPVIVAVGSD